MNPATEEYIRSTVDGSGYDLPDTMQTVWECFQSEYKWNIDRLGTRMALKEWLAGLPSSINIEWRNHAILGLGKEWGIVNEYNEDYFLKEWFGFMADCIIKIWRKEGII